MLKLEVNPHTGVLLIAPDGPLAAENVRAVSDRAEVQVRRGIALRGLCLRAANFPAWRDWAQFLERIRPLREQRGEILRVAVLSDSFAREFAVPLGEFFPQAQVRHFGMDQERHAQVWLADDAPAATTAPPAERPVASADAETSDGDEIILEEGQLDEPDETDSWFTNR